MYFGQWLLLLYNTPPTFDLNHQTFMSSALATTATNLQELPKVPSKQANYRTSKVERELAQGLVRPPPPAAKQPPSQDQDYIKKVPHRPGKPIIDWFQRKLAGTVRTRRVREENSLMLHGQQQSGTSRLSTSAASRPSGRSVSSPLPHGAPVSSQKHGTGVGRRALAPSISHRRTISLNDTDPDNLFIPSSGDDDTVDNATRCSSLARDSMWSPASALEADEDASLRPLPPRTPPSPSPSHSSSSYLSNPRTFRSIAASTKPTTVLSIDLPPAGIGHIAQVPPTPTQLAPRYSSHGRSSSTSTTGGLTVGTSITFSALPPSPQSPSGPQPNFGSSSSTTGPQGATLNGLQAPLHTAHHPRNNPRPWSPPSDNASVITLASSAFAIPGARMTMGSMGSTVLSGAFGGGDSISHLGGSAMGDNEGENLSQFVLGDDDRLDVDGERDADASLRALRPRSSRRGSWESEVSGWSARVLGTGAGISTGSKSLWTNNSIKTGELLGLEDDADQKEEEIDELDEGAVQESLEQKRREHVHVHDGTEQGNKVEKSVLQRDPIDIDEAPAEHLSVTLGRSRGQTLVAASNTLPSSF